MATRKILSRVKIHYPEAERQTWAAKVFHGMTGTIVGDELDGRVVMYRVRLDVPAHIPNMAPVHSDLWAGRYLRPVR